MDSHVVVNWKPSKRVTADPCHRLYRGLKCTTHWGDVFFKLSADQLLVITDLAQAQVHNEKAT